MEATEPRPSLHLSKCQIVGNIIPRLIFIDNVLKCINAKDQYFNV